MGKLAFDEAEIDGKTVQILNANPSAATRNNQPPLYLQPGWLESLELFPELVAKLREKGHHVLGVNEVHGIEPDEDIFENLNVIEHRQSAAIFWLMQHLEQNKVNLAGHSMGTMTGTAAAMHRPQNFHNFLAINGAGLIGPDSFLGIAGRHISDVAAHTVTRWGSNKKEVRHIYADALPQLWRVTPWKEVLMMGKSNVIDRIASLRAQLNDLKVIHTENDRTFPISRVREQLASIGALDALRTEPGSHYEPVFRQADFAQIIDEVLTELGGPK